MKKLILFLCLFFFYNTAYGASVIEYDPDNAIVSNRVINYWPSVDADQKGFMATPNCNTCPIANHLINADLSGVSGVAQEHWKVESSIVVEMSQLEKDNITSVAAAAAAAAEAASVALFDNTLASSDVSDYTLTKIDQSIDNINSLADAKAWLKKLARFIARVHK
jgi:hypothetical protein